jgi:DNA-binding NarL/FixJ family response regulator
VVRHLARKTPTVPEDKLTPREMQVLHLLAEGQSNQQIARRLALSVRTVETHLTHIYAKLSVGSRTEAVLLAQRKGLLAPP